MSEEDEARLAALRAEADALENEWADAPEIPEEAETRIAAVDEEIGAIVDRPQVYDSEEMARAGVFVSLDAMARSSSSAGSCGPKTRRPLNWMRAKQVRTAQTKWIRSLRSSLPESGVRPRKAKARTKRRTRSDRFPTGW